MHGPCYETIIFDIGWFDGGRVRTWFGLERELVQVDRMISSLIQPVLVGIYRLPVVNALLRTRIGSSFYVICYDLYKNFVEAAGNQGLARHISPGSWAIDVGANNGFFTKRFARWVKSGGRVIAIEPDPENLALLYRRFSAASLERIDVHQAVAVEKAGTVRLQRNPLQPTDHRISETGDPVSAVTLDEIVEQAGSPMIGLIKIDTQGSEQRVLAGATQTIRRCRPNLFVEVDDAVLRENGSNAVQLIDQIQSLGYGFFKLTSKGEEIALRADEILTAAQQEQDAYTDLLCIPLPEDLRQGAGAMRSGV